MPSLKTCKICYLILVLSACNLYGQQIDSTKQKGVAGFGGPDQVERRLEKDEEPKTSFFELEFMRPYFDFKSDLKDVTFSKDIFPLEIFIPFVVEEPFASTIVALKTPL